METMEKQDQKKREWLNKLNCKTFIKDKNKGQDRVLYWRDKSELSGEIMDESRKAGKLRFISTIKYEDRLYYKDQKCYCTETTDLFKRILKIFNFKDMCRN